MICQNCGVDAPTEHVSFYQNIGALVLRFSKHFEGYVCKRCLHALFWEYTGVSVAMGWFGIISLFINPFIILNNFVRYFIKLGMSPVPEQAQTPIISPEDIKILQVHRENIIRKLNKGDELNTVLMQVAGAVGKTPGQVLLYIKYEMQKEGSKLALKPRKSTLNGHPPERSSELAPETLQEPTIGAATTSRYASFNRGTVLGSTEQVNLKKPPSSALIVISGIIIMAALAFAFITVKSNEFKSMIDVPREVSVQELLTHPEKYRETYLKISDHYAYYPMIVYEYQSTESNANAAITGNEKVSYAVYLIVPPDQSIIQNLWLEEIQTGDVLDYVLRGTNERTGLLVYTNRFKRINDLPDKVTLENSIEGYLEKPYIAPYSYNYLKETYPDMNLESILYLKEPNELRLEVIEGLAISIILVVAALVPLLVYFIARRRYAKLSKALEQKLIRGEV